MPRFLINNRNTVNGIPNGIIYHRIFKPFQFLPVQKDFFWNVNEVKEGEKYDYLVFNRGLGWVHDEAEGIFIEKSKESGMKVIMDIDDYWELPEHHTIRWRQDLDYNLWRQNILNNIGRADYIWTSTEFLAGKIREISDKPIAVCKNAIDYDEHQWSHQEKKKYPNKINIGWIGSLTHYKDLDILRKPIKAIQKNYGNKIQIHFVGVVNNEWSGKVSKHNYDILTDNGRTKRNNITTWNPVPIYQYGHLYDQLDISISPVRANEFNKAKSELKVIEAGAKSIPFIGSNLLTYSRTDANIDLCNTPQEWAESLKDLINNKELRQKLGKELNEYVRETYTFNKSNKARLNIL